ncbi:lysylphosphatidylglycerol synthase transmembrane domain-containing protein [Chitinophaga nivalis]|uniref:Flippase-like domain-containing protein n=1 Tax=Chitinophaga nivalis TaxID=2991709 RepID=A0ABT3ILQ2_9BACT|nr:lysylphosphatidylglycerol synthase transmembrane domain-containing protein [Chitinophaga nivalis]MCW3465396.1 flippase-like domain-containing protein [Chitinophaga nivalis]MCW3484912.1 flippase-like domain-containing protein [Chitinophaga nivalis]
MPKMLKNLIKFVCFFGIGLLLIWLFTKDITADQWDQIYTAFRKANYWLVIPAIVLGIASHWFRAVRWKLLMKPLGHQPSTLNTFFAVMVGYLANLAVPRLGEVTRCGILAQYEKVPADKLVGTMIAERAVDLVCLLLLMGLTIVIQLDVLGAYVSQEIFQPLSRKLANANGGQLIIVAIGVLVVVLLLLWLLRRFARSKVAITIKSLARGVMEGILSIGKMKNKNGFLLQTVLIWVCYLSQVYIGFFCLKETSHLSISAALAVLIIGSVGMIVTPGGIGAYQPLVQKTLQLYNIPYAIGFAFGWIIWVAQTLLVIFLGFFSLVALPIYNKNRHQPKP